MYRYEFRLHEQGRVEELLLYSLKNLIENLGGVAISIIGVCSVLGQVINTELLIAKYIECLYFLQANDESEEEVKDEKKQSSTNTNSNHNRSSQEDFLS